MSTPQHDPSRSPSQTSTILHPSVVFKSDVSFYTYYRKLMYGSPSSPPQPDVARALVIKYSLDRAVIGSGLCAMYGWGREVNDTAAMADFRTCCMLNPMEPVANRLIEEVISRGKASKFGNGEKRENDIHARKPFDWIRRGLNSDASSSSDDAKKVMDVTTLHTLQTAAENGDATAQFQLGRLYLEGKGSVVKDMAKGVALYEKSAAQNFTRACVNLGWLLVTGEAVDPDVYAAAKLFTTAAEDGDSEAQRVLAIFHELGVGVSIRPNMHKCLEYYTLATKQFNADALCELGMKYQHGCGVPQNTDRAVQLFEQAIQQGHSQAQLNLGYMYHHGDKYGLTVNLTRALELYVIAAKEGNNDMAQFNAGWIYGNGLGVTKNLTKAAEYYRLAADNGHTNAMVFLGRAFFCGHGVEKDEEKGIDLIRLAAMHGNDEAISILSGGK